MSFIYEKNIIETETMYIDQRSYTVEINKKKIHLQPREIALLCLLVKHPGWVFTKDEIYEAVYEDEAVNNIDNIVFCRIYSLRKKIEPDPKHPRYIKTVRGVGYKFVKSN